VVRPSKIQETKRDEQHQTAPPVGDHMTEPTVGTGMSQPTEG
jgi:hypothetical protein